MKTLYFKYAQSVLEDQGIKSPRELDYESAKLLEIIAIAHHQGSPLTVMQAVGLSKLASPASLHRKLTQLRNLGYVEGIHEPGNRRTQFLIPTAKADLHFEKLGTLIQQASSSWVALRTKVTV